MVGKQIREVRCDDVLRYFVKNNKGMCFLTLTTPDVVTLDQIRLRWRNLRHYLVEREGDGFKYVMNYELHPRGHGWHIHGVFNRYINLRGEGLFQLRRYGFRMISVEKVTSLGVSQYLTKHCLKAYRGVRQKMREGDFSKRLRLVNTSRGLPKLSDYHWQSVYCERIKALLKSRHFGAEFDRLSWRKKYMAAEFSVLFGVNVSKASLLLGLASKRFKEQQHHIKKYEKLRILDGRLFDTY